MIQVAQFTPNTDQVAFYKAVQDRLNRPRRVAPTQVFIAPEPMPEPEPEEPTDTRATAWIPDGSPDALALYEKILNAPGWNAKATATRMVAEIADKHGVTFDDIMGRSRVKKVKEARFEAVAAVATTFRGWSTPILGKFFGGRDHSTIVHCLQRMGVDRS